MARPVGASPPPSAGDLSAATLGDVRTRAVSLMATLVLVGCTAGTPIASPTPPRTHSPTPSASATPRPTPPAPVARQAVFAADAALWLYDVKTNIVTQLATGSALRQPRWVSKTKVSFLQDAGTQTAIQMIDLTTRQVTDVATVRDGINVYAWSPDRETIAYLSTDPSAYPHLVYLSAAGDSVRQPVATLARALGRGSDISDQSVIRFSPDGAAVLVVYTPADGDPAHPVNREQGQFQVRGLDGSLQFWSDQTGEPTMGVWSGDGRRVYFRTKQGVRLWKVGASRSVSVRGIPAWFDPWASPDGRFVAFDTGARSTAVVVRSFDLRTGARKDVSPAGFFHPVVADAHTVWAQRVTPCDPGCIEPVQPGPEVFAFDTVTKASRKLTLTSLLDLDVRYE